MLLHLLPLAVFATEGDLGRVALHAVIVLFQTVVLVWVSDKVVGSIRRIEHMGAALVEQSQALRKRNHAAEQATRAKGMFLANMSHEIRTPINAIMGFCHLIQRSALDARQRDQIAKINGAGATLLRLVNDILDLSKGEAGQMTLEEVVFEPRAELSRQVQILSESLHRKNLTITVKDDPRIPVRLMGDVTRLNQVLSNLLGNAMKFTCEGRITVVTRLTGQRDGVATVEIAISDDGIGMTADQLSRMFTPFVQADNSTTRRFGGTGLGLAICRQIVEQMGGWIRAESEAGRGSTFTVMVPLRIPEQQALPPAVPSDAVRRLRVLLVDDNPIARRIVEDIFARWDMAIDMADAGGAGLAMVGRATLANRPYDMVIMDWKMPGLDGIQTLDAMRALRGAAPAPFTVMMTSYDIDDARRDSRGKGVDLFLPKPVDAESLLETLNSVPTCREPEGSGMPLRAPALPQDLCGLRVLLVEDNDINREIAAEILCDAGLLVDCAADGAIACRMMETAGADYAAVLMDIQMPEMDGLTATRRIRETFPSARLPIIAMTAHAFAEERRNCLEAGMDDHLTKPVDPAHLIATLERWLGARRHAKVPDATTAGLPPALPPFDLPMALARVNDKADLLGRLILSFADTYGSAATDLAWMIDAGRIEDAQRLAHTLKGVAGSLELPDVAHLAGRVEQALSAGDEDAVADLLARLRPHLACAAAAAQRLRPGVTDMSAHPGPERAPVDPLLLAPVVEALRDQIGRHSLSARQGFLRLTDLLHLDDAARQSHPVYAALQRLDYAAALTLIDRDFPPTPQDSAA